MVVAGLYDGQCFFYLEKRMRYYTQIECRNRSGRNSKGKKVTGLRFSASGHELLVTTNDSRLRFIRMDDFSMVWKYKGLRNKEQGKIAASLDDAGEIIVCGSQTSEVFTWRTRNEPEYSRYSLLSKNPKGKNYSFESFRAFSAGSSARSGGAPPATETRRGLSDEGDAGAHPARADGRGSRVPPGTAGAAAAGDARFDRSAGPASHMGPGGGPDAAPMRRSGSKESRVGAGSGSGRDAGGGAAAEGGGATAATVALFMPEAAVERVRPASHPSNLELDYLRQSWRELAGALPKRLRARHVRKPEDPPARKIFVVSSNNGLISCFEHVGPPIANTH
jgi:hypothetical protein